MEKPEPGWMRAEREKRQSGAVEVAGPPVPAAAMMCRLAGGVCGVVFGLSGIILLAQGNAFAAGAGVSCLATGIVVLAVCRALGQIVEDVNRIANK